MNRNDPISSPNANSGDFSLVVGGPLYKLYLLSRLARDPIELAHRRVVAAILIVWLPLAVLSAIEGHALTGVKLPFLWDLVSHAKLLAALPLLIVGEVLVHRRIGGAVRQFLERGLIAPEDLPR